MTLRSRSHRRRPHLPALLFLTLLLAVLGASTALATPTAHASSAMTTISLSGTLGDNGWYRSNVGVTLNCTGCLPGSTQYSLNGGAWITYTGTFAITGQGETIIDYQSRDAFNNWENVRSRTVGIDTIPPNTFASLDGSLEEDGWYQTPVQVSLGAADTTSGVASTEYRLNDGDWQVSTGVFTISAEGVTDMEHRSTDNAGNVSEVETVTVKIDTVAPATSISLSGTLGANGWYRSPVSVTLSATDAASGVASIEYRLSGGSWTSYAGPFTISAQGTTTVEYKSADAAGNVENVRNRTVLIDSVAPNTFASLDGSLGEDGSYQTSVQVSLTASDATSGLASTEYRLNGGDWQTYTGYFTVSAQGGHVLDYRSVDVAGNVETFKSVAFEIALPSVIEDLEALIAELEALLAGRDATIADLESQLADLKQENETLKGQKTELESEKELLKQENETLKGQKTDLESEKDLLKQENETLKGQKTDLELEKELLKSEKEGLEQEKELLKSEKDGLQLEKGKLQQEKDAVLQEKSKLEDEKATLLQEKAELEQAKQALETELAKYVDLTPPAGSVEATPNQLPLPNGQDVEVTLSGYVRDELSAARDQAGTGVASAYLKIGDTTIDLVLGADGAFNIAHSFTAAMGAVYTVELYATDTAGNSGLVDTTTIGVAVPGAGTGVPGNGAEAPGRNR